MVVKIHVLLKCEHCQGQAYLLVGEVEDYQGQKYDQYKPRPNCEGSGMAAKWVALAEVHQLLEQSESPQEYVSKEVGSYDPSDGVWDDVQVLARIEAKS